MPKSRIIGTGQFLPENVLTNKDLEAFCDTTDEWVRKRTGIEQRHQAAEEDGTSDLALRAATMAMENAGITATDLDAVIVCTLTPDQIFPAAANLLQGKLGADNIVSFDINAACSGYMCGLATANSFIESGMYKTILVVGAEIATNLMTWKFRDTAVLFGDGAGAAILQATDESEGFKYLELGTDGASYEVLHLPLGGSRTPLTVDNIDEDSYRIYMDGRELYKRAVTKFVELGKRALEETGLTVDDIALFVPHQANARIIEGACERLNIPMDKTAININKVGNTVAASIPMVLHESVVKGKVQRGDYILLASYGAGLTWGVAVLQW